LGEAAAVGGDALYRTTSFQEVGGFDPAFICGEEPELCFRLRRAGWRVARLDAEMTLHDAAMTRWSQWRKRTERTGWAFAEGAATYGDSPERYNVGPRRSVLFWGGLVPAGIVACLLAALALNAVDRRLAAAALAFGLLGLAAYPLNALRVARARARAFGDPMPHAVLYGALVLLGKPFEFVGLLRYYRARARGERGRIIEYKGPDAGGAA